MSKNEAFADTSDIDLVARRIEVDEQIATFTKQKEEINAELLERLPSGRNDINGVRVTISQSKTLNSEAISRDFPFETYPDLYVNSLNNAAVKEAFAPAALASYQKLSKPSVKVG